MGLVLAVMSGWHIGTAFASGKHYGGNNNPSPSCDPIGIVAIIPDPALDECKYILSSPGGFRINHVGYLPNGDTIQLANACNGNMGPILTLTCNFAIPGAQNNQQQNVQQPATCSGGYWRTTRPWTLMNAINHQNGWVCAGNPHGHGGQVQSVYPANNPAMYAYFWASLTNDPWQVVWKPWNPATYLPVPPGGVLTDPEPAIEPPNPSTVPSQIWQGLETVGVAGQDVNGPGYAYQGEQQQWIQYVPTATGGCTTQPTNRYQWLVREVWDPKVCPLFIAVAGN
ncbi:hypothetical protein TPY_2680 [Sulfobacillus acidophilus TPY]|nr:hypothetical protein TPY_2680 [Sulfobacillus acidophilus TPY]